MKKIIYFIGCILICISCKKDIVADFEITGSTKVGETVSFINHSVKPAEYHWDFGDYSTSTEENPIHIYSNPGTYTVTLKVTGENGSGSINKSVKITGTTYSFRNNTSFDLSDFRSFYYDGTNILDNVNHGILQQSQETSIVISTRPIIMFGFRYGDKYFIGAESNPLFPDTHNLFIITDKTQVYSGKGANDIFEYRKDQYFLNPK